MIDAVWLPSTNVKKWLKTDDQFPAETSSSNAFALIHPFIARKLGTRLLKNLTFYNFHVSVAQLVSAFGC